MMMTRVIMIDDDDDDDDEEEEEEDHDNPYISMAIMRIQVKIPHTRRVLFESSHWLKY